MEVTINIDDYLTEDEKKEIITDSFKSLVQRQMNSEKDIDRILSNNGYYFFEKEIEEIIPNYKEKIKEKVVELIQRTADKYSFTVFTDGSYGGRVSLAQKFVEEAVIQHKDLIQETVVKQITERDYTKDVVDKIGNLSDLLYELAENLKIEKGEIK
jgi:hypothetical protein